MAQLLSDEEFLSTSEKQPAATKVASAGKLLSDEEFLLGEEPFMTEARKGPSAMSVMKDIGGYTLGVLGQVEDMLAAVPRIASIFGAAGTAGVAAAKGESAKTVAGSALAYQESFLPEWTQGAFGKIATALGPEAKNYYENNGIAKFLGKFGEAVTEGSEKIENKTGIPAEASQLLVNTLMDYLGSKGVIAGVKHSVAKRGALEEARQAKLYEKRQAPYQPPPEEVARQAEAAETLETEQALAKEQLKRAEGPPPEVDLALPGKIFKDAKAAGYKIKDKDAQIISQLFESTKRGEAPVVELEGVQPKGVYDAIKEGLPSIDELAKWTKEARGKALLAAGLTAGGVLLANDVIEQGPNDEGLFQIGTLGGGLLAAGAVRVKGSGVWPESAWKNLSRPIKERLTTGAQHQAYLMENKYPQSPHPNDLWADKAIRNHLNKYFGTAEDPLAGIKIPMLGDDVTWGEVADKVVKSAKIPKRLEMLKKGEAQPGESIWDVERGQQDRGGYNIETDVITHEHFNALQSYLSHVGDRLRDLMNQGRLTPEKLQQKDLAWAVKETAKIDEMQAKAMEKARASGEGTTLYKEYPDGMRWVEVGKVTRLPSNVKIEQSGPSGRWTAKIDGKSITLDESYAPDMLTPVKDFGTRAEAETAASWHLSQKALKNEGDIMGHCVGGYCEMVHEGSSRIFSLRGKDGMSHVTMEVEGNVGKERIEGTNPPQYQDRNPSILQIKGKQNRAPVAQYLPYVQDFVKSGKWGDVGDLENAGLIKHEGRYLTRAEAIPEAIRRIDKATAPGQVYSGEVRRAGEYLRALAEDEIQGSDTATRQYLRIGLGQKAALGAAAVGATFLSDDKDKLTALGLIGVTAASRGKLREALKAAPEHLRDKTLVDLARTGNEAALEKIYKDNAAPLERSIATYKLPPGIDAQDVVARVFEKFFTDTLKRPQDAIGGFRGDAKVSSFLYGAVRNEAIKAMEKGRLDETSLHEAVGAEGRPLEETVGTTATSPETIALNTALGQKMQAALDKLPEHQRAIVDKVLLEGKDYATAAAELGVPEGTIRSGLSRAKETLQYSLREYRNLEAGKADPELLGKIALVGGAAAMGAALNDSSPLTGGFVGAGAAFAGLAALKLSPARAVQSIKSAFAPDTRIRINHLADAHDAGIAQAARAIWQQQQDVAKIAPKAADRIAITNAIQQNTVGNLPPALQRATRQAKQFFAALGEAGQQANVLKGLIDNYVTNLWDLNGKNKAIWDSILNRAGGPSMSPESRFALKRSIANLEVGKRLGLTPLTEDVAEIMGIYGNSLARTLENKTLLDALKTERDPLSGQKLLLPEGKSPHSYVVIDHPQMRGTRVHPDIAPSMRFIFDNSNPGVVARGLEGLNTAIKRSAVSFSLFHAKALIDALIGALGNPLRAAKTAVTSAFGVDKYLQMLRKGGAGDLVDDALKGGLKITFEKGKLVDEDIGGSFYAGLKLAQRGLDAVIPGAGLPVKAVAKINHLVDTFMWERLHAGMKLNVFADKLAVITESNAKAHARNPSKVPLQTKAELSAEAASFTNDIFGGLNWRRLAEEATTHWGRDVALAAYSSKGRRVLQLLMFAPDWTISTTRAATRAFGALAGYKAGSGLRGLLEPQNATDLHRQYIMRSALYYAIVGDGINYALSGHHLWENRDPTTIDMGDGRTMQWSKHSMEPIHWVTKPGQQALNKLGFVPKELANQMLGTEYLSAYGSAPKMDTSPLGRASHMGRSMLPIAAQQAFGSQASPGSGLAGFLGAPIYGKTYKEKQAAKEARKRLRQTPAYKKELAERKRERDRQRRLER